MLLRQRRRRRVNLVRRLLYLHLLLLLAVGIGKLSLRWGYRIAAAISEIYVSQRNNTAQVKQKGA